MKRILAIFISCMLLFTQAAFAAGNEPTALYDSYASTVKVSGTYAENKLVSVFVIKSDTAFTPANAVYADQGKCDENGNYSFLFDIDSDLTAGTYKIILSDNENNLKTVSFEYINTKEVTDLLKNSQTASEFKQAITNNQSLFKVNAADISDKVADKMKGQEFETIELFEKQLSNIMALEKFETVSAKEKLAIYNDKSESLGLVDISTVSDKEFVFEVVDKCTYNFDDVAAVNNFITLGKILSNLKDGGAMELDAIVNDVKNNASILGITSIVSELTDTEIKQKVKELLGETIYTAADFAEKFEAAEEDSSHGSGSGSSGKNNGGGGKGGSNYGVPLQADTGKKTETPVFNDLGTVEWAKEAIQALAERGIVAGTSENTFDPNAQVTREQFTKMYVMALALLDNEAVSEFPDVPQGVWSYPYVSSAFNAGIVKGDENGLFGIGRPITRQDMSVMLYRAASAARIGLEAKTEISFYDADSISEYAKAAVETLANAGVINGMDGNFVPNGTATRAQAAKMIYEVLRLSEGAGK